MSNFNFIDNLQINNNINSSIIENEEKIINNLIKDVYELEAKINILNNNLNNKEIKIKKLTELEETKKNLYKNISQCTNYISIETKKNDVSLEHKKIRLNELDQKINENKSELDSFNTINFKSLQLIKYIFSKKSKNCFLSKEEIDNILKNKNINNNLSVEEELKKINKELEINKASKRVIENNYFNYNIKKAQINENLKMLEEEKISSNDELIDIISCKETVDCIIKLIIGKLIKNKNGPHNNKETNSLNEDEINKPIDVMIEELLCFNLGKISLRLCDELYDIYDLEKKQNNYNYINRSYIEDNKSKRRSGSYKSELLNDENIENKVNYKGHIRSGSNNITNNNQRNNNNINNDIMPINININTKQIKTSKSNSDKKILSKLIQNEIETFLSTENIEINKNNDDNLLNDFLFNLSMIIINKIKNISEKNKKKNLFISSNDLMCYLSYFFKSNYFEIIINNNLKFIDKEYKVFKKDFTKNFTEINNELLKLEDKLNEIKIKEKINSNMIDIINNKTKESNNSNNNNYLTENEVKYLEINSKMNDLLLEKKRIEEEIEKNNEETNNKKEMNESKINKLNNEINSINNQIKEINNEIETITVNNNKDIINYRQIIAEKFNQIKIQLESYRNKKKNNIIEYNQFVEKINNSIKMNLNNSLIFNFDNLINGKRENEKDNKEELIDEKRNLERKLKKNKGYNNSIIFSGINGLDNDNTLKKLNRSMTGISIHNNKINNIYNIYNNNDNSFNFNNKSSIINKNKNNEILNKTSNNIYSRQKLDFPFLNKSKDLGDNQINLNIPTKKNTYKIYNISSLSNSNKTHNLNITRGLSSNKNNSTTSIRAKIKEIKKINNKLNNIKNNNIPNINKIFFQTNKSPFHIMNNNSSRVMIEKIDQKIKLNKFTKEKKSVSHGKVNTPSLPLYSQDLFFQKLNPLIMKTFCYYREIVLENNQNIVKYNPLKQTSLDNLNKDPYNFMKCSINLSDKYNSIKILAYNGINEKNELVIIKIEEIENTVVSSNIKKIIEIHRSYNKCKNMKNFSFEEFINRESKLFSDMNREDIKKSALNQNYNFSLITKKGKRLEFIITSYEEFKMWINGLAFIIKNKNEFKKYNNIY